MKKILLILFVFLGLQAQSQVVYCDSVSISISGSTPTSVTYTTLANPYINSFLYSFDISWNVTNFNTGAFITSDSVYNPTFNLNNLDTVLVCATATITGQGITFTCILCDTILYNGEPFAYHTWYARSYNVNEKQTNKINSILIISKLFHPRKWFRLHSYF